MNEIRIRCSCGAKHSVPENLIGKKIKCNSCNKKLLVDNQKEELVQEWFDEKFREATGQDPRQIRESHFYQLMQRRNRGEITQDEFMEMAFETAEKKAYKKQIKLVKILKFIQRGSILVSIAAAIMFYDAEHGVFTWIAAINAVIGFWSLGIMHNHAIESAKNRRYAENMEMLMSGKSFDDVAMHNAATPVTTDIVDAGTIPNWLSCMNGISILFSLGLIIGAIICLIFDK